MGAALNQACICYRNRQGQPDHDSQPEGATRRGRKPPDGDYCRQVFGGGTHLSLLHTYETATLRHL